MINHKKNREFNLNSNSFVHTLICQFHFKSKLFSTYEYSMKLSFIEKYIINFDDIIQTDDLKQLKEDIKSR